MRKAEAALVAGVSYSTLHRALKRGKLPHIKLGGKTVIIGRDDLFAWLDEHRVLGAASGDLRVTERESGHE